MPSPIRLNPNPAPPPDPTPIGLAEFMLGLSARAQAARVANPRTRGRRSEMRGLTSPDRCGAPKADGRPCKAKLRRGRRACKRHGG